MNWLAHILLSKRDIDYQLGNVLADPLKGKVWEGANHSLQQGMLMHKSIDRFTDAHPVFLQSKSRLGNRGYLKAVVIDLLYDHYLANLWTQYADIPLDEFLNAFNIAAKQASAAYPDKPKRFVARLIESDMLRDYGEFSGFIGSLERVDRRLSPRVKRKDSALNYVNFVEREYDFLKADFQLFFPELMAFFVNHPLGSQQDNYLPNSTSKCTTKGRT